MKKCICFHITNCGDIEKKTLSDEVKQKTQGFITGIHPLKILEGEGIFLVIK